MSQNLKIKYICFVLFILGHSALSLGCGSVFIRKQTMISYEAAGEVLKTSKATLKTMCDAGAITAEDCAVAREAYNDAVDIYKIMGNTAIIAMDTGDTSAYKDMQVNLMELLNKLAKYIERNE